MSENFAEIPFYSANLQVITWLRLYPAHYFITMLIVLDKYALIHFDYESVSGDFLSLCDDDSAKKTWELSGVGVWKDEIQENMYLTYYFWAKMTPKRPGYSYWWKRNK